MLLKKESGEHPAITIQAVLSIILFIIKELQYLSIKSIIFHKLNKWHLNKRKLKISKNNSLIQAYLERDFQKW